MYAHQLAQGTMPPPDRSFKVSSNLPHKLMSGIGDYIAFVNTHLDELKPYTVFHVGVHVITDGIIFEVQKCYPELLKDKNVFMDELSSAFDRYSSSFQGKAMASAPTSIL